VPNSTVKALVSVTSYLGADVSGAAVKLTWTVPLAKGEVNVTTDARVGRGASFPGFWGGFRLQGLKPSMHAAAVPAVGV
jgi:hypothetical protein